MESVSTKIYKSNYFILSMKKAPYSRRRAWGKKRNQITTTAQGDTRKSTCPQLNWEKIINLKVIFPLTFNSIRPLIKGKGHIISTLHPLSIK